MTIALEECDRHAAGLVPQNRAVGLATIEQAPAPPSADKQGLGRVAHDVDLAGDPAGCASGEEEDATPTRVRHLLPWDDATSAVGERRAWIRSQRASTGAEANDCCNRSARRIVFMGVSENRDSVRGESLDAAFERFVVASAPSLLRSAYVLTGDHADADDLLQNALLRTLRHWSSIGTSPLAMRSA